MNSASGSTRYGAYGDVGARQRDRPPPPSSYFGLRGGNNNRRDNELCHRCQQPGHIARACPNSQQQRCAKCGRDGHMTNNCPVNYGGLLVFFVYVKRIGFYRNERRSSIRRWFFADRRTKSSSTTSTN